MHLCTLYKTCVLDLHLEMHTINKELGLLITQIFHSFGERFSHVWSYKFNTFWHDKVVRFIHWNVKDQEWPLETTKFILEGIKHISTLKNFNS